MSGIFLNIMFYLKRNILFALFILGLLSFLNCPDVGAAVPSTPGKPVLSQSTFTQVYLTWTASTGTVTGYRIYRYNSSNVLLWEGASSTPTCTDTGLTPDTTYIYKVLAYNDDGNSYLSAALSVKTIANPSPVQTTFTKIVISWPATTGITITGYLIFKGEELLGTTTSTVTTYTDSGLTPDTGYDYSVRAYYDSSNGRVFYPLSPAVTLRTLGNPIATEVTFSKVVFSWPAATGTIDGYRVYRYDNNNFLLWEGTTSSPTYTDTGLTSDTTYVYKVCAYYGTENFPLSQSLTVRTLKDLDFSAIIDQRNGNIDAASNTIGADEASAIRYVLDNIDPSASTINLAGVTLPLPSADSLNSLVTGLKSAFSAQGGSSFNPNFTNINSDILIDFINRELTTISEAQAPASDAERIADQQELNNILRDNFGGNSFMSVYMQAKLTELGEKHWQAAQSDTDPAKKQSDVAAAKMLYNTSLKFLRNHEPSVFNTLNRLAMFEHSMFITYPDRSLLLTSLGNYKAQLERFFVFFPNSTSNFREQVYYALAGRYYWNFPEILSYANDEASQDAYSTALNAIQNTQQSLLKNQRKLAKITAWELNNVKVVFKTNAEIPLPGTVNIVNSSSVSVYPKTPALPISTDTRDYTVGNNGNASIPVYKGHAYNLIATINVTGTSPVAYSITALPHAKGSRVTYDLRQNPVIPVTTAIDQGADGELVFIVQQQTRTITASAGTNGSITPVGDVSVNYGSDKGFTITPDANYHIASLLVDGEPVDAVTNYTFTNVTANHTISVSFAINTHTITFVEGANGAITGTKVQTVNHGSSANAVTAVPNTGYHLVNWTGAVTSTNNPLTVENVTSDMTITANFAFNFYTVTFVEGSNGTITGIKIQTVGHGSNTTAVTAVPATGYRFVNWSGDVESTENPLSLSNVTSVKTIIANFAADIQAPAAPSNLILKQVTFSKAILSWTGSTDDVAVTGYRVYRDGILLPTTTLTTCTDTGLTPNTTYVYTVEAFDAAGNTSPRSAPLTVWTLKDFNIYESASADAQTTNSVKNAVNTIDPAAAGLSGISMTGTLDGLSSIVRNALGNISNAVTVKMKPEILTAFINNELSMINAQQAYYTDDERKADKQELDTILQNSFGGHSFTEVYMQSKLTELGEKHWQASQTETVQEQKDAYAATAKTLYNYSLKFLSDHEPSVFNTLNRLAMFEHSMFTTYSDSSVLLASLDAYKAQLERFFVFITTPASNFPEQIHYAIAGRYYWNFPQLLTYDNYRQTAYDSALNAIQQTPLTASQPIPKNVLRNQKKLARISAWELNHAKVSFVSQTGTSLTGTIEITNVSGDSVYPKTPPPPLSDVRNKTVSADGSESIPVYKGHTYNMVAHINVPGIPSPVNCSVAAVPHQNGKKTTYDFSQSQQPAATVSDIEGQPAYGEIVFVIQQPTFTITASAGQSGSTSPSGEVTVNCGANQSFTITPNANWHIADVLVDNVSVGPLDSYTFQNVTANHTISANFAINTHTVTFDLAGKGTRTGGGELSQAVNHGDNATAPTVAASAGWSFTGWDRTFSDVTADMTVTAQYSRVSYTVTFDLGGNGTRTGGGELSQIVNHGDSATAPAVAASTGWSFTGWDRTFGNVTTGMTVNAQYSHTYTLTYNAGDHGSISGTTPQTVIHGENGSAVEAIADTGYLFVIWSDGVKTPARTDTNVTANKSVTANFTLKVCTLTYDAGAHGTISGVNPQKVHAAGDVFYSFEDIENNGQVTGIHSGINFGAEGYWSYSQAKSGLSGCGYFSDDVTDRSFTLPSGCYLRSIKLSGGAAHSYTISDGVNRAVTDVLNANETRTIPTNWTSAGTTVTITTSGKQDISIDEICYWTPEVPPAEVAAVPATGWHFVSWSDSVETIARTETNVTDNMTVSANFAINTYAITASCGPNGTISPKGSVSVEHGATQNFTFTADRNFQVSELIVDDTSIPMTLENGVTIVENGATIYKAFNGVTGSHTVFAKFAGETSKPEITSVMFIPYTEPETVNGSLLTEKTDDPNSVVNEITSAGTFKVTATDNSGISRAEFTIDDAVYSDLNPADGLTYSWGAYWNATENRNGLRMLTVKVYDNFNNLREKSYAVNLTLAAPNYAPGIESPATGSVFNRSAQTVVCIGQPFSQIRLYQTCSGTQGSTLVGTADIDSQKKASFNVTLQEGGNTLRAVAVNRAGQGFSETTASVTLDSSIPLAPLTFAAKSLEAGQIYLSWRKPDASTIAGYNIYRSSSEFSDISTAVKLNATLLQNTSYTDLPIADGTYYYRVTMVKNVTEGTPSGIAYAVSDRMPPSASIKYAAQNRLGNVFGQGSVEVVLTLSETASAPPVLNISINGGDRVIPVILAKDQTDQGGTVYKGVFNITSTTLSGQAFAVLSVRDLVNNRGTQIDQYIQAEKIDNFQIDTNGPTVTELKILPVPVKSIKNIPDAPGTLKTVSMTATLDQAVKAGTLPKFYYSLSNHTVTGDPLTPVVNDITGVVLQGGAYNFSITLPSDAGQQAEDLLVTYEAQDDLGNVSTKINVQSKFQVYQSTLPPLSIPLQLVGKSLPGGYVEFTWLGVDGSAGYVISRVVGNNFIEMKRIYDIDALSGKVVTKCIARPEEGGTYLGDGTYTYAIASLRVENNQEAISQYGSTVDLVSDATPPQTPTNLAINIASNGIALNWDASGTQGEPVTYNVYRSASLITSLAQEGLQTIKTGILSLQAVDSNPNIGLSHYTVAAVDAVGNISLPAESVSENLQLLPITSISVKQEDGNPAELSWIYSNHDAGTNISGYNVYIDGRAQPETDGTLINAQPYTDRFYLKDKTREYSVRAVDNNGNMTLPRSIALPTVTIQPAESIQLLRGSMKKVNYVVHNGSSFQISNAWLEVECSGHTYRSGNFTVEAGSDKQAYVVIAGYGDLPDTANLKTALVSEPDQGSQYRIIRNFTASVADSVLPIELLNQEFVRGVGGKVQFILHNTSEVDVDIVTAQGNSPSSKIRFKLLDADGNVLALGNFLEAAGEGFISLASGDTIMRVPAGGSYTSAFHDIFVPSNSPDNVIVQLEIDNIYFNYGSLTQAVLDGISTRKSVSLVETKYYGTITSVTPAVSFGRENIVISGQSVLRSTGTAAPNAPLRLGLTNNGFDRTYDIVTDSLGAFTYEFVPQRGEAGVYNVWVVHPDRKDKTFQSQFIINSVTVSPKSVSLRIPYGYQQSFPIQVATAPGTALNNLAVVYNAADQPSGNPISGLHVTPSGGTGLLSGGQSFLFNINIWADETVPDLGKTAVLKVVSDPNITWATVEVNLEFFKAASPNELGVTVKADNSLPRIELNPNVILSGVARESSVTEYVEISNKGLAALENVQISLVNTNKSPAPSWVSLSSPASYPRIAVGETKQIAVTFIPTASVNEGNYAFYLSIASSNYPTLDLGLYPAVSDSGIGNILFKVADMYTYTFDATGRLIEGVSNARIYIQNTALPAIESTLYSDRFGEALFKDLPSGFYSFKVSRDKHDDFAGRLWVKPGITQMQEVQLSNQLVTVQWSVVPTTINDTYEISLNAIFETNVPAAVVAITPTTITLTDMTKGQFVTGQYKIANYGLIRAENFKLCMAESPYYEFELLSIVPETLEAKEEYTVPYRVTCIKTPFEEAANTSGAAGAEDYPCHTLMCKHTYSYTFKCPNGKINSNECNIYTMSKQGYCPPSSGTANYNYFSTDGILKFLDTLTIYVPPQIPDPAVPGGSTTSNNGSSEPSLPRIAPPSAPVGSQKCMPIASKYEKKCRDLTDEVNTFMCAVNSRTRQFEDGEKGAEIYDLQVHSGVDSVNVQRYYEGGRWYWWHLAQKLEFYYEGGASGSLTSESLAPFYTKIAQNGIIFEKASDGSFRKNTQKIFRYGSGWRSEDKFRNYYNYDSQGRLLEYGTSAYVIAKLGYTGQRLTGVFDRYNVQIIWYEYNDKGLVSAVRDRELHRTEYTYGDVAVKKCPTDSTLQGIEKDYPLTEVKDAAGGLTHYTYDDYGRITSKTDAAERMTVITYNPVQEVLDNDESLKVSFDATGKPVLPLRFSTDINQAISTDANGNPVSSDADGNVVSSGSEGRTATRYDLGSVNSIYDENVNSSLTFAYDYIPDSKLFYAQIRDKAGQVREVWYDEEGDTVRVDVNGNTVKQMLKDKDRRRVYVDEKGARTTVDSDEYGNVTKITYPDITTETFEYEYNFHGVTRYTDQLGVITEYSYDSRGLPILMKEAVGKKDADGNSIERHTRYTYDGNGNLLTQTVAADTAQAATSTFTYTAAGVRTVTDPVGNSVTYENYNSMGNPGTMRDDTGNVWAYEYDELMRLVRVTTPLSNVANFSYNGANNLVAFTAPNGKETTFKYDIKNNLVETAATVQVAGQTEPLAIKTRIIRNSDGLPERTIDPSGKISDMAYDTMKRLISVSSGGNVISYTYGDLKSTVPSRVDFPTFYRTFTYDSMQQISRVEEFTPGGASLRSIDFSYDVLGRVSTVTDKEGKVRRNFYDALGRLTQTIGINNDVTAFKFDARDNLIELTNASGGITRYEYDAANRITKVTTPATKITSYAYGKVTVGGQNFRTVAETLPGGETLKSWVNANGQLAKRETYRSDNSLEDSCQYAYDVMGNLLSVSNGVTSISFTYDDIGRKLSETTDYGASSGISPKTNNYEYNENGTLKSYTGPDGITYSYKYDEANRLTSIEIPGRGPIVFNSYKWNSPLQMTFPGGAFVKYSYDALMRTTGIESRDPLGLLIGIRGYAYDAADNIVLVTETGSSKGYGYDQSRFLSSVSITPNETNGSNETNETFTYDLLGNRLQKCSTGILPVSYSYNADNQLLTTPEATYEYDANGSLIKKTIRNTVGDIVAEFDYVWNAQGQLVEFRETGVTKANYAYDPFGRRISKKVYSWSAAASDWQLTADDRFAYNIWGLCGEYDADGQEIRSYGYSPNSMAPLFLRQNDEIYYYLTDHMGTPQKIISASGRVVWSAVYNVYGKAIVDVEEINNNFRFPGQYFDPESGLHYNFFRYYDVETGRYISVDPARSGINFYTYCNANPLNFADPYGLCGMRDDPMGMAGAFGQGLGQGGLNLLQGIQDTAVDVGNSALAVNNPLMMMYNMINGPMFSSPQWARDVLAEQSDGQYEASKFLTSQGALTLLGATGFQFLKGSKIIPTAQRTGVQVNSGGLWARSEFKCVKVSQRNDLINPNLTDKMKRTNIERMRQGLAPIGPDGKPINLHHTIQTSDSPLVELTQTFHQQNSRVIHINPNTTPSGINRSAFDKWRAEYWMNRANDF